MDLNNEKKLTALAIVFITGTAVAMLWWRSTPLLNAVAMVRLPRVFWPKPDRYGLAVAIDESGNILKSLHDPSGDHLRMITSVTPHQDKLYFGSLENDRIGRL